MDVLTVGETLAVGAASRPGPLRMTGTLELSIAGAESNVAIGLSRLGFRVAWTGRVGADELGALVVSRLRAEGVDTAAVRTDDAAPTALMIKERRTAEVTRVQYYRTGSAGSRLQPSDVSEDLIAAARVVHLTGITPALSASARETVWHVVRVADAKGVPVSFDVNYRSRLWDAGSAAAELSALAAHAAFVFAGEDELPLVTGGASGPDAARELARKGPADGEPRQVVIKYGSRGAAVFTADGAAHSQPAVSVVAVDPVGAGDAFAAGYLAGFLNGQAPQARLSLGCRLGAFAVSCAGDWEGLPTPDELGLLGAGDGTTQR
jgi:2-dehydro-3-deoxygluconokinase